MKETEEKTILTWIMKHKKTTTLCGGLVILIVVPLVVYGLSEVSLLPVTGGNDWAGFWGGYIGAFIGGLCTVIGVFLSIRYEREKGRDDAERAVLPYIALTTLEKENKVDYFHLKTENDIDDEVDGYTEFRLNKIYFIIRGENAIPKRKLTKEQRVLLENEGHRMEEMTKGVAALTQQRVLSVPMLLTNVGNGAAINFRVGFHLSNTKYNDKEAKYTVAKHLEKGVHFYLNLFFEDLNEYTEEKQFILRIHYENIYAQEYLQEYLVTAKDGKYVQLDLGNKQKKCR